MIAFFPEIYPDELLYSQLARYHGRSGYARYVFTVADIYNNEKLVHPNVDFVNRYTPDAMQWITKNEPWEVIAEQHTMYPAYIRFLPKLRRIDAVWATTLFSTVVSVATISGNRLELCRKNFKEEITMREFTKITIREWLSNYENGKYSNSDFETMCEAGWYDWFCSDDALANKLRKFAGVIKNVTKNDDFILDNFTLRFKNLCCCCSESGYLYDMIRFAPMDEQEKDGRIFCITIGNKRTGCTYGVWAATKKYAREYNVNYQKELIPYVHKISAELQAEYASANK